MPSPTITFTVKVKNSNVEDEVLLLDFPRVAVLVCFPVISLALFPFYLLVNRKNRKKDKNTATFPFTNYFYRVTCLSEPMIVICIISLAMNYAITRSLWMRLWTSVAAVIAVFKITTVLMLNILTSLLALHRSLLYFFPSFAENIAGNGKQAKWLIWVSHCVLSCTVLYAIPSSARSIEQRDFWNERMLIFQYALYGLVLTSTLPYFLMILSIRKLKNLVSKAQFKPERYIMYQIIIMFVAKILMIPFLLLPGDRVHHCGCGTLLQQLICETVMVSLIIQSSYLLSNKSNWDTFKGLLRSFEMKYRRLFRITSKVEPKVYTIGTTITYETLTTK